MRTRLILLFVFSGILQGLHAQYNELSGLLKTTGTVLIP